MEGGSLWARFGLATRPQRAWVLYDWANSAFMTTVVAAVFPIYFKQVVAAGLDPSKADFYYTTGTAIALAGVALIAPLLGRLADRRAWRKAFLFAFTLLGALATIGLYFPVGGDVTLALVLFGLANLGAGAAVVFYDSLLPHVAGPDEVDQVSTAGFALGYLGGGLLLAVHSWMIQSPGTFGLPDAGVATRVAILSVGVWWLVFTVPLLRRVPEPPKLIEAEASSVASFKDTLRELRRYPEAFKLLVAFLIYNDGILTIIRTAALFAAGLGFAEGALIKALLLVQFIGLPAAFVFGAIAKRTGSKRAILGALVVYCVVTRLAGGMTTEAHFFTLAMLVGCVQGGAQALSRSLFSSLIPQQKSAEFFGFFAVGEKFAGVFGQVLFAAIVGLTGDTAAAIQWLIGFFVVGGLLLTRVDVEAGRRAAREADARPAT